MIALGAAQGLAYLHHDCKPKIIHRDIKSNNILLDENFEAHVGDFGLAKIIDMPQSMSMSAVAGSYGYIAPWSRYGLVWIVISGGSLCSLGRSSGGHSNLRKY
ncbi:hypothetical protein ACSBR1_036878 [Camellia fascicularis]